MGHLSGITLVYIIPIIIYNLNESGVSNNKIIINWIIAGLGIFVGMNGLIVSIKDLLVFYLFWLKNVIII